jgi:AcrR family transcriptional regulator
VTEPTSGRGRATRVRLLDAATALIPEVGWGGVTTRRVAERAGVNPALVHYHFSSVTDLLIEAVLRAGRLLLDGPASALVQAADVRGGIDELLAGIEPFTGSDPASLLMVEAFLAAPRHERLRRELAALLEEFRSRVAGWLRSQGHPEPTAAAAILAATVDGLILHRAVDPSRSLESFRDVLTGMFSLTDSDIRKQPGKQSAGKRSMGKKSTRNKSMENKSTSKAAGKQAATRPATAKQGATERGSKRRPARAVGSSEAIRSTRKGRNA